MIPTLTFKFDCWGMKEITGKAVQVTSTVWQFDFDSWGTKRGTGTATKVTDDLWTIKFNSWGTKEGSGSIRRTSEHELIRDFVCDGKIGNSRRRREQWPTQQDSARRR